MILSLTRSVYIFAVLLMAAVFVSCGGGGGSTAPAGTGTLNLSLTDAASGDYKAVYVTINEVWVKHEQKTWEKYSAPELQLPKTLNLLDFVNGARAELGILELETGHYNQMRLILEDSDQAPTSQDLNILDNTHPFFNYVVDSADNEIFLKVPSGGNTGIKIVNGFDIEDSRATELILDFDAHKSVHAHPAGKSGTWILRPMIKVVETTNSVSGDVDTGEDDSGVWVSAQVYDTAAIDFREEVESVAGVFSKVDGTYFMFLPINTSDTPYNIVATKNGFAPECQALDSTASQKYTGVNFILTPEDTGTVSGSIINLPVPGAEDNYSAFLSIRKYADCDGDGVPETMVEVVFKAFPNGTGNPIDYGPITLSVGDYELIAWADGAATYPPIDIIIEEAGQEIIPEVIDFGP
ncbi:MAG: hypothetical protein AMJ61_13265 [Desulfobacterales bacterium SG8_35_2]|nr:MAG: hypothetical protein AMJ61_13265 [Desulfobacterales bacterium SG8_35_2]